MFEVVGSLTYNSATDQLEAVMRICKFCSAEIECPQVPSAGNPMVWRDEHGNYGDESHYHFPTPVEVTFEEKLALAEAEAAAHGPYAYGDTSNPVAQVRFEESQRVLAEQVAACRYCKAAQTRAAKNHNPQWEDAMCTNHRDRSRLNFLTSPVSETYWCS